MTSPESSTLLIHAPVGRHFAQLHRDTVALADSVALFADAGLRKGTGVVLIATKPNTELFLDKISRANSDVDSYRNRSRAGPRIADPARGASYYGVPLSRIFFNA